MRLIIGLFCCLGASLVLRTVDAVHYDMSYMQAPCDNSRNFTLGANGYQRYGFIKADDDGCYNPHGDCHIRLSVSSGYFITLRLQWISIKYPDLLIISGSAEIHSIAGYIAPSYSINSTSNRMVVEFNTYAYIQCLAGFSLYYTSFHYGECSENEFRCPFNERCIPNEVVCDSYDNCGDWSDEWTSTCSGSGLTTGSIVVISVTWALVAIAIYSNINSIYEDPDQIHPPPYQSTFTTTPYGSNNNESLTCDNDNTPHRLNNHEDNSNNNNRADRSNSNDAIHF